MAIVNLAVIVSATMADPNLSSFIWSVADVHWVNSTVRHRPAQNLSSIGTQATGSELQTTS